MRTMQEEEKFGGKSQKSYSIEDKENVSQLSNLQHLDKENIPPSKAPRIHSINSIPISSKAHYSDFSTHKIAKHNGSIAKHHPLKKRESKKGHFLSGVNYAQEEDSSLSQEKDSSMSSQASNCNLFNI